MTTKRTPSTTEFILMIIMFVLLTLIIHQVKDAVRTEWTKEVTVATILGLESILIGIVGIIIMAIPLFITDNAQKIIIKEIKTTSYYDFGILFILAVIITLLSYLSIYFINHDMGYVIKVVLIIEVIVAMFSYT